MIDTVASSTPPRVVPVAVWAPALTASVLTGPAGYAKAAAQLRRRLRAGAVPDHALLDWLWSSRERRQVSLLALALRAEGVAVSGLHVRAALAAFARARRPLVI